MKYPIAKTKAGPIVDIQTGVIFAPEAKAYIIPGTLGGISIPRKHVAASSAEQYPCG